MALQHLSFDQCSNPVGYLGLICNLHRWTDRPHAMTQFLHLFVVLFVSACRKPCLKASSYSTAPQLPAKGAPIRVAPLPKRCKKLQNVFLDNQGFPDQSNKYNHLLHSIDRGTVLRKFQHPMTDLEGPIDPRFDYPFIPEEHKDIMRKQADLSHIDPTQQEQVYSLIREFW